MDTSTQILNKSNNFSEFVSDNLKWILTFLFFLVIAWSDNRYISHSELTEFKKDYKIETISNLITLENDLRQRQDKKIKQINDLSTEVDVLQTSVAVLKVELLNMQNHIIELKSAHKYE